MATRIQYPPSQFGKCWLACLVATGWFLFACTWAWGHDWYDPKCCSGKDCRPIDKSKVIEGPSGYKLLITNELFKYGNPQIKQSADDKFHWCQCIPTDFEESCPSPTRCLYVPGRGM